jgi:hypothetical protein
MMLTIWLRTKVEKARSRITLSTSGQLPERSPLSRPMGVRVRRSRQRFDRRARRRQGAGRRASAQPVAHGQGANHWQRRSGSRLRMVPAVAVGMAGGAHLAGGT